MKPKPLDLGEIKAKAIAEYGATQFTFPLIKQPPAHLDSVELPTSTRKSFALYQRQFKGANFSLNKFLALCPVAKGDTLYYQEPWSTIGESKPSYIIKANTYAGGFTDRNKNKDWQPAGMMPVEAARIVMRVSGIRLQRLQSVTQDQALAEGPMPLPEQYGDALVYVDHFQPNKVCSGAVNAYQQYWRSEYSGKLAWEKNPWVWIISFEVIRKGPEPESVCSGVYDGHIKT